MLIGAAALVLTSPQHIGRTAEDDLAERGRVLAEQYCARCHAVTEEGGSPHPEAPPFRTFAAKWQLEHLEESLAEGIVTGHPDMPAYEFDPPEIQALIEHMHVLAEKADEQQ